MHVVDHADHGLAGPQGRQERHAVADLYHHVAVAQQARVGERGAGELRVRPPAAHDVIVVCGRRAAAQQRDPVTTGDQTRGELVDQQLRAAGLRAGDVPPRHDHHPAAPALPLAGLPLTALRTLVNWGKEGPIDLHA